MANPLSFITHKYRQIVYWNFFLMLKLVSLCIHSDINHHFTQRWAIVLSSVEQIIIRLSKKQKYTCPVDLSHFLCISHVPFFLLSILLLFVVILLHFILTKRKERNVRTFVRSFFLLNPWGCGDSIHILFQVFITWTNKTYFSFYCFYFSKKIHADSQHSTISFFPSEKYKCIKWISSIQTHRTWIIVKSCNAKQCQQLGGRYKHATKIHKKKKKVYDAKRCAMPKPAHVSLYFTVFSKLRFLLFCGEFAAQNKKNEDAKNGKKCKLKN